MPTATDSPASVPDPALSPGRFQVGTLVYSRAGLITLFLFLLWGDFCFTLMETVVPSILPLKLNALGSPNWALGLIVTTIPNVMNTLINPFASFRSDRFRSRWGRRIPFLAGATPFLVIFLILLGYSEPISRWLRGTILGGAGAEVTVLLAVIGVFMVCFQFFNLFVTSIYYYLFNDVVPHAFLARFMALFRIVGTCAGALYNYFVLRYAYTHAQEIFLVAGLLYLVAFAAMCWKVREGNYPPPPDLARGHGLWATVRTYAAECFTHRFYWYFFLANSCLAMTWVSGAYGLLSSTKVAGLDLAFVGKVGGICGVVSMALLYPAGMLADRFHPLRVLLAAAAAHVVLGPLSIAYIFNCHHFSADTIRWLYVGLNVVGIPVGALYGAAELPTFMQLLPRDRYGQFCSANALVRSVALILGGVACGVYLDVVKRFSPNPDDCYRFVSIWNWVFYCACATFLFLLYREWRRLGGTVGDRLPGPTAASVPAATPTH